MIPVGNQKTLDKTSLIRIGLAVCFSQPANNENTTGSKSLPTSTPVLQRETAMIEPRGDEQIETNQIEEQQENITFGDTQPAPAEVVRSITDPTRFMRDDEIAHLGQYLSRPVLINTWTWTQADSGLLKNGFNPWSLFFNDSHIKSKLNNFARLQCSLRLKFVLNASPFYYGLLKVNYDPLKSVRQANGDQVTYSQLPGPYITPQDMSSVEMRLPFFWPRDYLNICSQEDFNSVGYVSYSIFSPLQSANAVVAGQITISCYAWAEDVHLAAPTSINALQGPISNVSRTVGRVAHAVSSIPPLAGIGAAVSAGASMVTDLATALGFSNEPVMDDVRAVQVKTFHAMANTEQSLPLDKLCLDPDNKVSLSPQTVGLADVDELALSEFCSHEAWIAQTAWVSSQASATHLVSFHVTPHLQTQESAINRTKYCMTPTRYASRFYRFWRGSMIYRIRVVGTKFHKGRLQISWDPQGDASGSVDTETTNITKIVDLDAEQEVEFIVPFKASRCWNSTSATDAGGLPVKYGAGAWGRTPTSVEHNGCISIFVQNQLSAPVDPSTVDVVIFARAGPDFELAAPIESMRTLTVNEIQGPVTLDGSEIIDEAEIPTYTVGERTSSLRQLLHRTVNYGMYPRMIYDAGHEFADKTMLYATTSQFRKVPMSYGYTETGDVMVLTINEAPGTIAPFNFVNETPLATITNCFAGYRGSVNWHVAPLLEDANDRPIMQITKVPYPQRLQLKPAGNTKPIGPLNFQQRANKSGILDDALRFATGTVLTTGVGRFRDVPTGLGGTSVANTALQPFVSVNIPQYAENRFQVAYEHVRDKVTASDTVQDGFSVACQQMANPKTNRFYNMYVSAGNDYNLFYFVCCPPLYAYETPYVVAPDTLWQP